MANNRPIGVYDSGMGGLTVWREIRRLLPRESLIYLGDGKNCPYGGRTREQITGFAREAVRRLVDEGCKMIVVVPSKDMKERGLTPTRKEIREDAVAVLREW